MLDRRGQLLRAAVGFATCSMPSYDRALWALRTWLDSWPGIGHVSAGMHQGYDLQLTQRDDRGWRATFYAAGMEHSQTSGSLLPRRPGQRGRGRSGLDDLHVRRGDQPLGRRRLTRLLVRGTALVRVAAFS